MASSVVGPRRSSEALPKAKLAPKKYHGHCLVVCGLSVPLRLSESWQNHYIWEQCSAYWWDAPKTATPEAGIGQRKGPNSAQYPTAGYTTNACFKSQMNWTMKYLPHLPYSPDLSPIPTDYYFSKHLDNFFRRGNASTTSRRQKIFSKSSSNLQAQMFTLQE